MGGMQRKDGWRGREGKGCSESPGGAGRKGWLEGRGGKGYTAGEQFGGGVVRIPADQRGCKELLYHIYIL